MLCSAWPRHVTRPALPHVWPASTTHPPITVLATTMKVVAPHPPSRTGQYLRGVRQSTKTCRRLPALNVQPPKVSRIHFLIKPRGRSASRFAWPSHWRTSSSTRVGSFPDDAPASRRVCEEESTSAVVAYPA